MAKLDLAPDDWDEVKRILRYCLPAYEVWAFGSRAKGVAKPYSDLDLAIISEKPLSIAAMADLRNALDESDLTIKVDVIDWATTSQAFRDVIREHYLVVQEKDPGNTADEPEDTAPEE